MYKWWHERVVYQIYPRSFKDSNGDGIGDIQGIISELDKLKALGIGIIWLSPVYCSPNADNGYDISDYYNIHPDYGSMDDMDALLEKAKTLDIKIVMDLVINHTSDEHEWFEKSRQRVEPYTDYYIWQDQANNWTSFFAEDAWTYDEVRQQYYLHLFAKKQPDLNYHNPLVLEEIKKLMIFWLEKGVSGFRCDVINVIYKTSLEDGKKKLILTGSEHYLSQEGNHEILQNLRETVLNNYDCFTVGETVFVTPEIGKELCEGDPVEMDMIFSFEHMETDQYFVKYFKRNFSLKRFARAISKWQTSMFWNANYLENHDQRRAVSRFGDEAYGFESAKMLGLMLLALRGTPYIYQGQEIGMTNFDYEQLEELDDIESHNVDAFLKKYHIPSRFRWSMLQRTSRDNCRTPMQWNRQLHGGFTSGQPWLKVNDNYQTINLESQLNDTDSVWHFYKKMIAFRQNSPILLYGDYEEDQVTKNLYVFKRTYKHRTLYILLNFSKKKIKTNYKGQVKLSTLNRTTFDGKLDAFEAIILG